MAPPSRPEYRDGQHSLEDQDVEEGDLIPWPKGTVKVDMTDVYDWYKLGQHISKLKDLGKHDFGQGPPQTVMAFGSEPLEHEYLRNLKKLGLKTHDIDEDLKQWLGRAALGAALATGGAAEPGTVKDADKKPQQVQVKPQEPRATPKNLSGTVHEKILTQAAQQAGIKGQELAQFLAQTAHETGNFKHMREIGHDFKKYEPRFLKDKKGRLIKDPETGRAKNFNPRAHRLGNTEPGDGRRYCGRGYIQLTGRYNYARAGQALGLDLVKQPELVERPEIAARVAVWFWQQRVQPRVRDFDNTRSATKPINPGLRGLDDREQRFQVYKVAHR